MLSNDGGMRTCGGAVPPVKYKQLERTRANADDFQRRAKLCPEIQLMQISLGAPQDFEDYKSKYLDIHDKTKADKPDDAASIIDEVDFELELIQRDEINVAYILGLLAEAHADEDSLDPKIRDASKAKRKMVYDLLGSERHLRSKRELIEKFVEQHMPMIPQGQPVNDAFNAFWDTEKTAAIGEICKAEKLDQAAFKTMIEQYHFTGKKPLQGDIVEALNEKPKILERKSVVERIGAKLLRLVSTFDEGLGSL